MNNSENTEVIKALYDNGLLDKSNYEIALEKGLRRCKFKAIKDSAYQYVLLDIDKEVKNKKDAEDICEQFSDFLSRNIYGDDDFYYDEGWAAERYMSFDAKPIKAGLYPYDTDELHTLLIIKIKYIYAAKLSGDPERFVECDDLDECSNLIDQVKNGLKLFLQHSVGNTEYDSEGGFFDMTLGYYIENELPGVYIYKTGKVNEDSIKELEYNFELNYVDKKDIIVF